MFTELSTPWVMIRAIADAPCPLPRTCSELVSLGITTAGMTPDAEYPFEGASFASLYVEDTHTRRHPLRPAPT
jgi:hypothetical protein